MADCIFCRITKGEIPKEFHYESDLVVAFDDIHPKADIHVLIVPKKHIPSFLDIKDEDKDLLMEMVKAALVLEKSHGFGKIGYRMVFNGGKHQEVPHLHWHLLGDRS